MNTPLDRANRTAKAQVVAAIKASHESLTGEPTDINVFLDASLTKRAAFGNLFARPGDLIDLIGIAAARAGASQYEIHMLGGIQFDLAVRGTRNSLVDIEQARLLAERVLSRSVTISIVDAELVVA